MANLSHSYYDARPSAGLGLKLGFIKSINWYKAAGLASVALSSALMLATITTVFRLTF